MKPLSQKWLLIFYER